MMLRDCRISAPHSCNKTLIKELYKSCRTLAADQAVLDIMQIAFHLQPMKVSRRGACPPSDCDVFICYDVNIKNSHIGTL